MTRPVRVQQRRTRGWRKPENTVSVARPSMWGNHWIVVHDKSGTRWQANLAGVFDPAAAYAESREAAATVAVNQYRKMLLAVPPDEQDWATIRGKNLMCFCPLDQPCHADVLLELANQDAPVTPDAAVPDVFDITDHLSTCDNPDCRTAHHEPGAPGTTATRSRSVACVTNAPNPWVEQPPPTESRSTDEHARQHHGSETG